MMGRLANASKGFVLVEVPTVETRVGDQDYVPIWKLCGKGSLSKLTKDTGLRKDG
jgi:hypothetical protein